MKNHIGIAGMLVKEYNIIPYMKNHIGIAGMLVKNIITAEQKTEKRSKPESPGRDLRYNIQFNMLNWTE